MLPYQSRILETVAREQRIAIRSCHDLGKTFTLAKAILWFGSCFPKSKIITTAPTWQLVETQLWSEIRAGYRACRYNLGGRMLQTQWKLDDDWFALGLSPREDADSSGDGQGASSSFQGFHGEYVLIVFDEATGVPPKRWLQAEGMMTSANVKIVAIGNPTTKQCDFARCFSNPLWAKLHLSCFDSPNLGANGIANLSQLIGELDRLKEMGEEAARVRIQGYRIVHQSLLTLQWVMERALTWGIDHPMFQSKALGNFPEDDANTLFPMRIVEAAMARKRPPRHVDRFSLGIDVARFGNDRTVLTPIAGLQGEDPKVMVKRSTSEVAGEAIAIVDSAIKRGFQPSRISVVVDGTGVGAGVVDALNAAKKEKRIPHEVEIREVHFGQGFQHLEDEEDRDYAMKHYANMKAKLFVEAAHALKQANGPCLPKVDAYLTELPSIPYFLDSRGRYVIMSKDEYTQETGLPSPDFADSFVLAVYGMRPMNGEVGVMRIIRA